MYAPNITKKELLKSGAARRKGIDNSPSEFQENNLIKLSWFLQSLRDKLSAYSGKDTPINISSGFRCEMLNAAIGGSKTSAHVEGLAADISVVGIDSHDLALFIEDEMEQEGYEQLINEFDEWVHVAISDEGYGFGSRASLTASHVSGKTVYTHGIKEASA